MIFQQILSCLTFIFTFFSYLWILTPPSDLFWPFLAVSQGTALKCTWGTYICHNQCWESKFGNIHLPYCNFWILLSSGLLVAFMVLWFKLKTFSNAFGPNDPKMAKKVYRISNLLVLAFDLAFTTFIFYFGLFWPF